MKSLTFIILNPESNPIALRSTIRTISDHFPENKSLCVVGKKALELDENKKYTNLVQGGNTITSLIDAGIKAARTTWCFIMVAGTFLRSTSLKKYDYFCRSEKDILFPIVDRKYAFDEATVNGILIPKKAIDEVGNFGDNNHDIKLVKLLWMLEAIKKDYKFKAIIGARLT